MNRYLVLLFLLLQLCGISLLSRPTQAQDICPNPYIIQPGDYFGAIATKCGVTQAELRAANLQVTNPNLIRVGQQLVIPIEDISLVAVGEGMVDPSEVAAANGYADSSFIEGVSCSDLNETMFVPTPFHLRHFLKCGEKYPQIAFQSLGIERDLLVDFQKPVQIEQYTIQEIHLEQTTGTRELLLATTAQGIGSLVSAVGDGRRNFALFAFGNTSVGEPSRFDVVLFLLEAGQWRFYGHTTAESDNNFLSWQIVHASEGSWLVINNSGYGTGVSAEHAQWLSLNADKLATTDVNYPISGYVSTKPTELTVGVATTAIFHPHDEAGFTLALNFRISYSLPPGETTDLTLNRSAVYRWYPELNQFVFMPEFSTVSEEHIANLFSLQGVDFLRFADEELNALVRNGMLDHLSRLEAYLMGLDQSPEQQQLLQSIDLDK